MLEYLNNICSALISKKQINLSDFNQIRITIDDTYNKVKDGNIWLCYFDKKYPTDTIDTKLIKNRDDVEKIAYKSIGYVSYNIQTGQIGLFFINKYYQDKGLGKQILSNVIQEISLDKNKSIWVITPKDHQFWSNIFDKSFEFNQRPHNSVTGSGYLLNFNKYNNYLTNNY